MRKIIKEKEAWKGTFEKDKKNFWIVDFNDAYHLLDTAVLIPISFVPRKVLKTNDFKNCKIPLQYSKESLMTTFLYANLPISWAALCSTFKLLISLKSFDNIHRTRRKVFETHLAKIFCRILLIDNYKNRLSLENRKKLESFFLSQSCCCCTFQYFSLEFRTEAKSGFQIERGGDSISVTRLKYFWTVLATTFLTKVA